MAGQTMQCGRPIEALEERRLLAATLLDGVLEVRGGPEADEIIVERRKSRVVVRMNEEAQSFPRREVDAVRIEALGGDDLVRVRLDIPTTVFGGAGNDTLLGGTGADELRGGQGDDVLEGGAGPDLLMGEAGRDVLRGLAGADRLEGGIGGDRLFGGGGDDLLDGGPGRNRLLGGRGGDISLNQRERLGDPDEDDARRLRALAGGDRFGGGLGDGLGGGLPIGGLPGGPGSDPIFGGGGGPVFGGGGGSLF